MRMRYSSREVSITARPNRWGTYTVRRLSNGEILNTEIMKTYEDALGFCRDCGFDVLSRWTRICRIFWDVCAFRRG